MLKYRYILFFVVLMFALGTVSASDLNDTDIEIICDSNQINEEPVQLDNTEEIKSDSNGKLFEDIQHEIDNADEGSEIELSGTYTNTGEYIEITKNITLNGNHKTVLDANKSGFLLLNGVNKSLTVKGITFINSNCDNFAIECFLESKWDVKIIDCRFENNHANIIGLFLKITA